MERIKLAIAKARDSARQQGQPAPDATGAQAGGEPERHGTRPEARVPLRGPDKTRRMAGKWPVQIMWLLLALGVAGALVYLADDGSGAPTRWGWAPRTDMATPAVASAQVTAPSPPAAEVLAPVEVSQGTADGALELELEDAPAERDGDVSPVLLAVQVETAVEAWRAAWMARDMTAYLDAYSGRFVPANGSSRADWLASRYRNVGGRPNIEVGIRALAIELVGEDRARARFLQDYASGHIRETGQPKTLDLVLENQGRWRIVGEWSGQPPPVR